MRSWSAASQKTPTHRYQSAGEVRAALEMARTAARCSFAPALDRLRRSGAGRLQRRSRRCSWRFWWGWTSVGVRRAPLGGGGGGRRPIRMAVLPFANLSGDPEQEYLSDGLTQEMITQLGKLHPEGLSVIARTSVMRYKGGDTPIDQIGRELDVDYVLEGSAQREGDRVRIAAELIQVDDQTQLWADTFERELSGILVVQSEVAQEVANALALELLPEELQRLASADSVNSAAPTRPTSRGPCHWTDAGAPQVSTRPSDTSSRPSRKTRPMPAAYAGLAWVWAARQQMRYLLSQRGRSEGEGGGRTGHRAG